jgi:hypothetical protein
MTGGHVFVVLAGVAGLAGGHPALGLEMEVANSVLTGACRFLAWKADSLARDPARYDWERTPRSRRHPFDPEAIAHLGGRAAVASRWAEIAFQAGPLTRTLVLAVERAAGATAAGEDTTAEVRLREAAEFRTQLGHALRGLADLSGEVSSIFASVADGIPDDYVRIPIQVPLSSVISDGAKVALWDAKIRPSDLDDVRFARFRQRQLLVRPNRTLADVGIAIGGAGEAAAGLASALDQWELRPRLD